MFYIILQKLEKRSEIFFINRYCTLIILFSGCNDYEDFFQNFMFENENLNSLLIRF